MTKRNSGSQSTMNPLCVHAEQAGAEAVLEDQHEQAVRRADRQQVQHDRGAGDDDRAEGEHQHQERDRQHEAEDQRQVRLQASP